MYPNPNDMFQQQLNNLAKSYSQLSPMLPQPMTQPEQVKSVSGIAGAREYLKNMVSNSSQVLMDDAQNVFYLVRRDANGTPSPITIGKFNIEQEPAEESPYVTRQDFESFKDELRQLLQPKGDKQ